MFHTALRRSVFNIYIFLHFWERGVFPFFGVALFWIQQIQNLLYVGKIGGKSVDMVDSFWGWGDLLIWEVWRFWVRNEVMNG